MRLVLHVIGNCEFNQICKQIVSVEDFYATGIFCAKIKDAAL